MTDAEFARLADTFGADLSRWPAAAQHDAAARLRGSAPCRAALADAGALDALLQAGRPALSAPRVRAIVAATLAAQQRGATPPAWRTGRRSAGLFLASMLLLGLSLGWLRPTPPAAAPNTIDALSAASGEGLFAGLL